MDNLPQYRCVYCAGQSIIMAAATSILEYGKASEDHWIAVLSVKFDYLVQFRMHVI